MNNTDSSHDDHRSVLWQVLVLGLSLCVLAILFVESVLKLPEPVLAVLDVADTVICIVFIGDFFYQLVMARSKRQYLKWGWLDLVSSIPAVPLLRLGRLSRIVRIVKVLRGLRSAKVLVHAIFRRRSEGVLASVALASFVMVLVSAIAILHFEVSPNANIRSAGDALWWAATTITTVGYGDCYPVSTEGRILAIMLLTAGVGLFGAFTAYIGALFAEPGQQREEKLEERMLAEIAALRQQIARLEQRLPPPGR
jgi:voltage-gated potassium channel